MKPVLCRLCSQLCLAQISSQTLSALLKCWAILNNSVRVNVLILFVTVKTYAAENSSARNQSVLVKNLFTCRKYTFFLHSDPNTTEMPLIPGFGGNLGFQHFILWPASFSAGYETNVTEGHEIYNILFWALAIAFASCLVNFFRSFRVLAHGSFVAHFLDLISPVPFLIFTILLTELIFKVVFSTKELLKADTVFSFSWIYVLGVGRAKK